MSINLTKPPIPLGDDEDDIRQDPILCYTCWNLYGGSATTASFSPAIAMHSYSGTVNAARAAKVKDIGTGPKWAGGPYARADYTSWSFDIKLESIPDSAASGCQSCHLLQLAVAKLSGGTLDFKDPMLYLEVVICLDTVLSLTLCQGYMASEDQFGLFDDDDVSSDDRDLNNRERLKYWELYTLPGVPCPWPTIGNNVDMEWPREDRPAAIGGSAQHISPDAHADGLFDRIKSWIRKCQQEHPICAQIESATSRYLPKRVLDIGPATNDGIHLIEYDDAAGKITKPYIALSHCWGKTQHITTKTNTLEDRRRNIPFQSMSRVFQDAIIVARKLDIQYIWIDSLCIIQDDAKDWEIEAAKMTAVYNGAYLVIASTSMPDGDGGCLFDREPYITVQGTSHDGSPFEIYGRSAVDHHVFGWGDEAEFRKNRWDPMNSEWRNEKYRKAYPLMSRAWCFQERMLATRMLHFTKDEVVFECGSSLSCECGALQDHVEDPYLQARQAVLRKREQASGPGQQHGPATDQEDWERNKYEIWREFMIEYSQKNITQRNDSLPAIAGLANKWQINVPSGRYLAGIWEHDLLRGLAWVAEGQETGQELQYIAPSWSWLSVLRSVSWGPDWRANRLNPRRTTDHYITIDLEKSACYPLHEVNPFGQVSSGHLFVTGDLMPVRITQVREDSIGSRLEKVGSKDVAENFLTDSIFRLRECQSQDQEIYCLRFSNYSITKPKLAGQDAALVLMRATKKDLERQPKHIQKAANVFVRLGITDHYFTEYWNHAEDAQRTDLYLI